MVCHHDGELLLISTFLIKKKVHVSYSYTILLLVYFVLRLDLATLPNLVLSSLFQASLLPQLPEYGCVSLQLVHI